MIDLDHPTILGSHPMIGAIGSSHEEKNHNDREDREDDRMDMESEEREVEEGSDQEGIDEKYEDSNSDNIT